MSYGPPRLRAHTSLRATGRLGMFSIVFALSFAFLLLIASVAMAADPPPSAGWHGRAIQQPYTQPQGDAVTTTVSVPAGWSAGAVHLGTGFRHADGSQRVREVQQLLWNIGFRPGPVDGLFGPQTRAAVQWFQIKHGYPSTGVVDLRTLMLMRERTAAAPAAGSVQEPVRGQRPAVRGAAPHAQPAAQPVERGQKPAGGHSTTSAPVGLAAVVLLLLAAPLAVIALRRRRTAPPVPAKSSKPRRPSAAREAAVEPAPQTPPPVAVAPEQPAAIGYVRSSRDYAELARHAGTIRQACNSRGWKLGELVRDDNAAANGKSERPGWAAAMERLSGPGESRLVVSKLAHLSRSAADLTSLFEWFAKHDVQVIAADAGIDTTSAEGQEAARALLAKVARRQAQAHTKGHNGNGKARVPAAVANGKARVPAAVANGKGDHG